MQTHSSKYGVMHIEFVPAVGSGRQSIMVRSMDAVSKQAAWLLPSSCWGCHAAEKTQSSCPTSTASIDTEMVFPATTNVGCGAYLCPQNKYTFNSTLHA